MHGYRGADYGRISSRACWKYKTEHASAEVTNFSRRRATVGGGARAAGMSAARDDTSPEASASPVTVQFLEHLTAPGGYGLSAENVTMGLSQWRESEIVAALLRDVERRAPDAIVGRIFTAVNQDGLVVLIGEASEPDDWVPSDDEARVGRGGESRPPPPPRALITDCFLSACTLDPPVNLGAPDGRVARCVMLVMIPEDDLDADWCSGLTRHAAMRVVKGAFKRLAKRGDFLTMLDRADRDAQREDTRRKIEDLLGLQSSRAAENAAASAAATSLASQSSVPSRIPSSPSRRSLGAFPSAASSRRLGAADFVKILRWSVAEMAAAETGGGEKEGRGGGGGEGERTAGERAIENRGFAAGVRGDVARRFLPHYASDWTDGATLKSVSASLLMYFGCLAPCIAFGALTDIETDGAMGATEYLIAQAVSGVAFSFFAGQPEIVLRTTGPSTVFLIELNAFCAKFDLPFASTYAWTGVWAAAFMTIVALSGACDVMVKNCTRFTQEIFGLFVSAIFISAGGSALVNYFHSSEYDLATALMSLVLGLLTLQLGLWALAVRTSPFLLRFMRELTADFGTATAIAVASLVAWGSGVDGLEMLSVSTTLEPRDGRGSWLVDLREGPSWLSVACVVPGALLALLMYVEMNVSSLLANKPENNLTKGPAYHLNFLVMALTQLVFSFFGLPPMTGSLPHSPQFIRALSDVEEITVGGQTKTKVIRANENRVAPLAVYSLIALTLVMLPALRMIPMAVLYGLFLLLGITGMATSQLWTRTKMIAMDPRLLPPTHYVRRVPISRVHAFTGVQLCCAALLLGVRASPAALFFPLFIASLMPFRYALTHKKVPLFTPEMLRMLDMIAEGSNAEAGGEAEDFGEGSLAGKGFNRGKDDEEGLGFIDGGGSRRGGSRRGALTSVRRRRPSYQDLAESTGININGAELLAARKNAAAGPALLASRSARTSAASGEGRSQRMSGGSDGANSSEGRASLDHVRVDL